MSFLSQANSTETLGRGLELLDSMSAGAATAGDPSPEEMMAELQRLQASSVPAVNPSQGIFDPRPCLTGIGESHESFFESRRQ